MDIGTYAAASAGVLQMRKLEIQNNNLANVNTVGFKRQYLVAERQDFNKTIAKEFEAVDKYARGDQSRVSGVAQYSTFVDFSVGPIKNTGNPFDAALTNPNDFFIVNTPEGRMYTRAGNFSLSADGTLVTQEGYAVQGDGGPIVVNLAGAQITQDGSVRAGVNALGRIQIVRFAQTDGLVPVGGNRFRVARGAQPVPVDTRIEPRSLELSNVSAVTGMIDLITTNRAFEAYTKAAQTIDNLNQAAINQVGKRQ